MRLVGAALNWCFVGGSTGRTTSAPHPAPDAQQVLRISERGPKQGDINQLDPQQLYNQAEYQIAKEIFVGLLTLDHMGRFSALGPSAGT
jgi:hypothetical protein